MVARWTRPREVKVTQMTILQHPRYSHVKQVLPELHLAPVGRKAMLVALGTWALLTGRGWLVHTVHAALLREGLTDA
jgi:hypothetical protein